MATRIKALRKKQANGSFADPVPFGTDGTLVDMLSGLNNEIEMKLGGNHTSTIVESIVQNENVTTVTEKYKAMDNNTIVYSIVTTITEHNDSSTTIVSAIYSGNNTTLIPLNVKTITIPPNGTVNFTIGEVLS